MSRTNILIDDQLIAKFKKATGIKTKRAMVDHALRVALQFEQQKKLLELEGKVHWEGDLKSMRRGRYAA